MQYNFVHNSGNEVLFKIFAEITITSAEKNDTPKKFWIEIWIENLVDWHKMHWRLNWYSSKAVL